MEVVRPFGGRFHSTSLTAQHTECIFLSHSLPTGNRATNLGSISTMLCPWNHRGNQTCNPEPVVWGWLASTPVHTDQPFSQWAYMACSKSMYHKGCVNCIVKASPNKNASHVFVSPQDFNLIFSLFVSSIAFLILGTKSWLISRPCSM